MITNFINSIGWILALFLLATSILFLVKEIQHYRRLKALSKKSIEEISHKLQIVRIKEGEIGEIDERQFRLAQQIFSKNVIEDLKLSPKQKEIIIEKLYQPSVEGQVNFMQNLFYFKLKPRWYRKS